MDTLKHHFFANFQKLRNRFNGFARIHFTLLALLVCGVFSLFSMESVAKKGRESPDVPAPTPKEYLAIAEEWLIEGDMEYEEYGYVAFYLKQVAAQEEDLESRARAALHLGHFYYFKLGGYDDDQLKKNYLRDACLAACQVEGLKEIVKIAQILRQKPFNVYYRNHRDESLLHYATRKGYLQMIMLLWALGGEVLLEEKLIEQTPLYLACCQGHTEVMIHLRDKGARLDTTGPLGKTLLHTAIAHDQKKAVKLLLEWKLDLTAKDILGHTPLYDAVITNKLPYVKLLHKHGASITDVDSKGWTPLHQAAAKGYREMAAFFIRNGLSVDCVSDLGNTPLHLAAFFERPEMVAFLLHKGANKEVKNKAGKKPVESVGNVSQFSSGGKHTKKGSPSL